MGRLERYIFRQAFAAFILCLLALTAVVWMTQALRELDLVTLKGQGLIVFFMITGLAIPALMLAISPFALIIAVVTTLNRLNADSELVVMASAGVSRGKIAKPFIALSLLVAVFSGFMSIYGAPAALASLRVLITNVRADIISSVVKEGRFTELDKGLTLHIREKGGDGSLLGLLVNDEREPKQIMTYLAERGQVTETPEGTYLLMQNGAIQRRDNGRPEATIIIFQTYAIDLSQFTGPGGEIKFKPRERSTWDLLQTDFDAPEYEKTGGKMRGELHERLSAPLYPIAFVLIALAFLGDARTNRQSRFPSVMGASFAVAGLRGAGFGISSAVVADGAATPLLYLSPILATVAAIVLARENPLTAFLGRVNAAIRSFFERVAASFTRQPRLEGAE